ncbi:hypothetical protein ACIRJO_02785 [Streptomyces sp. NPDC102394]|uniref:hypothetical protein n=1 Tax=Streptomyces sp. NPDC102394 TaxID=3366167 RepID=UPI00382E058D
MQTLPATPAEVAAAVLEEIESHPAAFDMNEWVRLPGRLRLAADQAPACGSALCAAGWAAHVTGWAIVDLPEGETEDILTRMSPDGREFTDATGVYAEKDGVKRLIWDVAREVLGLEYSQTFWYAGPDEALARLREIAGR